MESNYILNESLELNKLDRPTHLPADYVELVINVILFFVGFPLNLLTLIKLLRKYFKNPNRLSFLHINLNIADLMVLGIYSFGRICWLSTYGWFAGDFLCRLLR